MKATGHCNPALVIGLLGLCLYGCSTLPQSSGPIQPAQRPVSKFVDPGIDYAIQVYDPFETFNRGMYAFNAHFDEAILLPVVRTYERITPNFLEDRVSNFFSNISDIRNLLNSVLQLNGRQSATTFGRLVANTTFGVLGLWDPATAMGMPQVREDFGQTLGYYGVGAGPYLVLPFLGPSNLRDTGGLVFDSTTFSAIDPLDFSAHPERQLPYYPLRVVDARQSADFRYYESGSAFEYDRVRFLYTRYRQFQIDLRRPEFEPTPVSGNR